MASQTNLAAIRGWENLPPWQRLAFWGSSAGSLALLASFVLVVQGATQRGAHKPMASAAAHVAHPAHPAHPAQAATPGQP